VRERRQPCASAANQRARRQPTRAPQARREGSQGRARSALPLGSPQKEIRIEDPTDDVLNSAKRAAPRLTHSTCRQISARAPPTCASAADRARAPPTVRERRQPCASAANRVRAPQARKEGSQGRARSALPLGAPKKRDQDRRSDRRRAELREALPRALRTQPADK
jgi:hypothetical protein